MLDKQKSKGLGADTPPDLFYVEVYFMANHSTMERAHAFFGFYACREWKNYRNQPIKNWKVLAWQWIYYSSKIHSN